MTPRLVLTRLTSPCRCITSPPALTLILETASCAGSGGRLTLLSQVGALAALIVDIDLYKC
jgi:hypothetical protein